MFADTTANCFYADGWTDARTNYDLWPEFLAVSWAFADGHSARRCI